MTLSQEDQPGTDPTPAKIACEPNVDRQSVSHIIDQNLDLGLNPLREHKVQKLTDSNIKKHMIHSRKLLSHCT